MIGLLLVHRRLRWRGARRRVLIVVVGQLRRRERRGRRARRVLVVVIRMVLCFDGNGRWDTVNGTVMQRRRMRYVGLEFFALEFVIQRRERTAVGGGGRDR